MVRYSFLRRYFRDNVDARSNNQLERIANAIIPARRFSLALWLIVLCLMSGVAGIIIGPDANWDLRNYHIYNSYAFLEGRHAIDIAPAQRQSYHNPTAGLPLYALMFAFNEHPRLVAALMSLPYGIAIAAIAWLSSLVLPFSTMTEQVFRILAATVIGATGAATLGVIGSTMNEIPISTLIIFALAITCARLKKDNLNYGALFAVGFCVGIAGGLKLTYAVHGLAIGCALVSIVFLGKISIRELLVSALGVIVGLGLSSGWWFWHLYELFGNPVFPYYNDIFRSPFAEQIRFDDSRFLPKNLLDGFMYPFRWVFSDSAIAAEIPFRDLRFGTVILLSFTAVLTIFGVAITQMARPMTNILQLASSPHRCCIVFLNVYALVAFILWVTSFGIYRYTVPLEMISGVLIVLLLLVLVRRSAQAAVLITMTVFLIVSTQPLMWGRGQWAERFINVEMPPVPGNALLVLIGGEPMGYIGAFVPPSVRVIGIENNFITSEDKTGMAIEIRNMLHNHPGPIFAVIPRRTNPESRMLDESGLRTREHDCAFVTTNIDDGLRLCQLVRDSNSH